MENNNITTPNVPQAPPRPIEEPAEKPKNTTTGWKIATLTMSLLFLFSAGLATYLFCFTEAEKDNDETSQTEEDAQKYIEMTEYNLKVPVSDELAEKISLVYITKEGAFRGTYGIDFKICSEYSASEKDSYFHHITKSSTANRLEDISSEVQSVYDGIINSLYGPYKIVFSDNYLYYTFAPGSYTCNGIDSEAANAPDTGLSDFVAAFKNAVLIDPSKGF